KLGEAATMERGLEKLIDPRNELGRARVGARSERGFDFVQRFELTEKLHVAQAARSGEHLSNALDFRAERFDPDGARANCASCRMIGIVRIEHRRENRLEDCRLIFVVPDVLEHEKVAGIRLVASIEKRTRRKQLHELDHATIRNGDSFGPNLKDETF